MLINKGWKCCHNVLRFLSLGDNDKNKARFNSIIFAIVPGNRCKSKKKKEFGTEFITFRNKPNNRTDIKKTTVLSSEVTKQQNEIRNTTESAKKPERVVIENIKILLKKDIENIKKKSTGNQDLKITLKKQTMFLQTILFYG